MWWMYSSLLYCVMPRGSALFAIVILNNLKAVTATDSWKVMKESHPMLEKEISRLIIDAENVSLLEEKERLSKLKERKLYLQLYEAMEALVHICRDGCRTVGPYGKLPKQDQEPCGYAACKGLELLVRHFAACKLRVPGGCIHCKRMRQLLELHARLCADSDACGVPLRRNFKHRSKKQNKKDEMKWKILARKILRSKSISGTPYFSIVSRSIVHVPRVYVIYN
ncbi:BTB/POZ and TAZ domain-containing protein [Drosera capensis]